LIKKFSYDFIKNLFSCTKIKILLQK